MAKVDGLDALQEKLQEQKKLAMGIDGTEATVIVGYTAAYAMAVHEDVEMKLAGQRRTGRKKGKYWDPQGRAKAKFLEGPFRELSSTIVSIVGRAMKAGQTFMTGLLLGGLRIQRESQKQVPVDTGNLKASAFTRIEQ